MNRGTNTSPEPPFFAHKRPLTRYKERTPPLQRGALRLQGSHAMRTITLLFSALLFVTACSPKKDANRDRATSTAGTSAMHPDGKPSPPSDEGCRADKFSRFPKLPLSDKDLACAKDSDCTVTTLMNGSCCDHGCNARWVYPRTVLQRLRARQKKCCEGIKHDCPLYRCPRDRFVHTAKCVSGRCKHVQTPAAWTLKSE